MSASNVANPNSPVTNVDTSLTLDLNSKPNARRRMIAIVEKSNADMHGEVGLNGVNSDRLLANGTPVNIKQAIRGESVIDRSRDLSQLRKGLNTSNVSPHRRKVSKHEKNRWHTVLSIATKNLLLLAALLWLGQTIYGWTYRAVDDGHSPFASLNYEGQVSNLESSLKKMTTMLQVQLEVLDKKIISEIGLVKRDFKKQIEERGIVIENELKELEARTNSLDRSLGELKEMGLLSKEEFESFWDELKKSKSFDGSASDVSLDEVRALAKAIVEKEIEKHAADGLGRVDYALASGGARVVRHSEPSVFGKSTSWLGVTKGRNGVHDNAKKMLEPSFGEPGQCFALQGSNGFVEVRLREVIVPEAVTLEHVSKSVAYDRSSAPKTCRVYGWFQASNDDSSTNLPGKMNLLTEFEYDLEKSNAQTFSIETTDLGIINMVRFEFTSNHGNSGLTCIYRFRVHGYEPSSTPTRKSQA
ncbi:hypothetical protein J5N97_013028 [Dioscorea zingiberensis]|uniref:SUN domain-containing protein n=1 Tax=Dioscorea zingiberensis TaxID=325984 RepID=A0A9D5HIC5_9LILI|nr:hypothetical protein J5N97_013028 [Dioscorea zingiberensis]